MLLAQKDELHVSWRENLKLIVVSVDVGKGEQSILTLSPAEAVALGSLLTRYGTERGGKTV